MICTFSYRDVLFFICSVRSSLLSENHTTHGFFIFPQPNDTISESLQIVTASSMQLMASQARKNKQIQYLLFDRAYPSP